LGTMTFGRTNLGGTGSKIGFTNVGVGGTGFGNTGTGFGNTGTGFGNTGTGGTGLSTEQQIALLSQARLMVAQLEASGNLAFGDSNSSVLTLIIFEALRQQAIRSGTTAAGTGMTSGGTVPASQFPPFTPAIGITTPVSQFPPFNPRIGGFTSPNLPPVPASQFPPFNPQISGFTSPSLPPVPASQFPPFTPKIGP
ncbi:MAG TPA: hypothetical protein VH092_35630, partial [Urbifossiella sp.]|nr:hypothetical protein [Urbifossiella sp.]